MADQRVADQRAEPTFLSQAIWPSSFGRRATNKRRREAEIDDQA
jgi:hypothetical protein